MRFDLRENPGRNLLLILGAVLVTMVVSVAMPWATPFVWLPVVGVLVWKAPVFAALIVVGYAGRNPDVALYAAPALLILSGFELARLRGKQLNQREWFRVASIAGVALLLSFTIANQEPDDPPQAVTSVQNPAAIELARNTESRDLVVLLDNERLRAQSDNGRVDASLIESLVRDTRRTSEEEQTDWPEIVYTLLSLLLVALSLWAWRTVRIDDTVDVVIPADIPADVPDSVADSVRRLQRIGAQLGRERKPHEGVLTYANELAQLTGDPRLLQVGRQISEAIYDADATSVDGLDEQLNTIEDD